MSRDTRKNGKFSALGLIIWIVAAVVLFIIFLVNRDRIMGNLKSTGFFDRIFGTTPSFISEMETPETKIAKNDIAPESDEILLINGRNAYDGNGGDYEDPILYKKLPGESSKKKRNPTETTENVPTIDSNPEFDEAYQVESGTGNFGSSEDLAFGVYSEQNGNLVVESAGVRESTMELAHSVNPNLIYEPNTTDPVKSPTESPTENVSLRLFFIELNTDGTRTIKEVPRLMKKTATPLTDTINALIDGPTPSEAKNYSCLSMVSAGTRLLSASVKNGIATLNFSEEFEFNSYGIEGVMWELEQVVYTATAFPSVEKVQFLIEGAHREYISEGLRIGEPLGRDSL